MLGAFVALRDGELFENPNFVGDVPTNKTVAELAFQFIGQPTKKLTEVFSIRLIRLTPKVVHERNSILVLGAFPYVDIEVKHILVGGEKFASNLNQGVR